MSTHLTRLRRAAAIAGIGLLFGTATTLAGTGVNAVLNLDVKNTVNGTTTLTGATGGPQLSVANTSTASGARAITATSKSASVATEYLANTGGGPALSVNVPPGKAPLAVSAGAGKVPNLDADNIDGLDSKQLAKGTGVTVLANRVVIASGSKDEEFLALPGLGVVQVRCRGDEQLAYVDWRNNTSGPIDVWGNVSTEGDLRGIIADPGLEVTAAAFYPAYQQQESDTLILGRGNSPGPRTAASVPVTAYRAGAGQPCGFQATATVWTSS